MSFEEENLELEDASYSPSSVSRLSTHVTDAALVIENELKGNQLSPCLKIPGLTLYKLCVDLAGQIPSLYFACCKSKFVDALNMSLQP
jgi:hypothetical protein